MFQRNAGASGQRDNAFWLALAPTEAYELARIATAAAATGRAPGVPVHEHLEADKSQSRIRDALGSSVALPSPGLYVIVARGFEYARSLAHTRRPLSPERRTVEITDEDLRDGLFLALGSAADSDLHDATSEFHTAINNHTAINSRRRRPGNANPGGSASPGELASTHARYRRTVEDALRRGLSGLQ